MRILPWFLALIGFGLAGGLYYLNQLSLLPEETPVVTHTVVLERIEGLGKLELLKYQFSDVVSHEIMREWLPDPKVVLLVQGETVACVDFTRIDSSSVLVDGDTLLVTLPDPEICYHKIDHQKSKIYETEYTFFYEGELVDAAYKQAENQVLQSALDSGILDQSRGQAEKVIIPMLRTLTGKHIDLRFQSEIGLSQEEKIRY
ncbi:MAG: DUF4230 domain-containing protein [Bacteroidota bacterium]